MIHIDECSYLHIGYTPRVLVHLIKSWQIWQDNQETHVWYCTKRTICAY